MSQGKRTDYRLSLQSEELTTLVDLLITRAESDFRSGKPDDIILRILAKAARSHGRLCENKTGKVKLCQPL